MDKIFAMLLWVTLQFAAFGQEGEVDAWLTRSINDRSVLDTALHYADLAYDLSVTSNDDRGAALALACKGVAYHIANQRDTAVALLYRALPEISDDPFYHGMTLWYLGKVHVYARDFDKGISCYNQAVAAFDRADSSYFVANVFSGIGIAYGMQTKYVEALDWFIKAYELKRSTGRAADTANELANISTVYMWLGNYEKSLEFAWQGIHLRDDDNDAGTYLNIGGIFNLQERADSALYYYEKGLEMAERANNPYTMRNGLMNIANVYYQQAKYREAIQKLDQAKHLVRSPDQSTFGILTELGKNYQKLNMLDSATFCLREGLAESRRLKNLRTAHEASRYLSQLFAEVGAYDSAYYYATLSEQYADSVNNDQIQEIFANERVRLETMDNEFKIEQLEQEALLRAASQRTWMAVTGGGVIIFILIFLNYRSRMMLKQKTLLNEKEELASELEKKKAILSSHTLNMIHRKNGFDEIEASLNEIEGGGKQKIKNIISVNQSLEKDWDNFQAYFSQVHTHFFDELKVRHCHLTQQEIRLAALIKMDLTSKEIASLLNIESKSAKMARYRLKKKLSLGEETDLADYLQSMVG